MMNPYLANLVERHNNESDCFAKVKLRNTMINMIEQSAMVEEEVAKLVFKFLTKGKVEVSCEKCYESGIDIPSQFKKALRYCGVPFKEIADVEYNEKICFVYVTPILSR